MLLTSLTPGNPLFLNTIAALDAAGRAMVRMVLPNDPRLVGLMMSTAFLVLDPASPLNIRRISPPLRLTIQ